MKIEVTPEELGILRSLVEMTSEASNLTYSDWHECNPELVGALDVLDDRLTALDNAQQSDQPGWFRRWMKRAGTGREEG